MFVYSVFWRLRDAPSLILTHQSGIIISFYFLLGDPLLLSLTSVYFHFNLMSKIISFHYHLAIDLLIYL